METNTKKFRDLEDGDVFSTTENKSKRTLSNKVMRPNGFYDAYIVGKGFDTESHNPDEVVYYFGKTDDERFLNDEELEKLASGVWGSIKSVFSKSDADKISMCYSCDLFGKSGYYGEVGKRLYYVKNLVWLRKLKKMLDENGVVKVDEVSITKIDDVPNLKRSIEQLSETYGKRECLFDFKCGEKHLYC